MSEIHPNALSCIGNTPIVRLNRVVQGHPANFFGKLEYMNPGGSVKDRIGYYLIEDAEKRGLLKPGGTDDVESSG
jgi:cystathionine beta-synthase